MVMRDGYLSSCVHLPDINGLRVLMFLVDNGADTPDHNLFMALKIHTSKPK